MRKRKLLALLTVGILMQLLVQAQQTILGLETYFEEAYWRYPNIPRGVLEAAAYSASRMTNLQPSPAHADNCTGMPQRYGLFALVENGRGYFKNNLLTVCNSSNITPDQYNKDVRLQILAVAKFLSREASFKQIDVRMSAEEFAAMFDKLAEFPDDSSVINKYALALYKYDIYDHLRNGFTTPSLKRAPVKVQMELIFPAPLLRKLQSPNIEINAGKDSILYSSNKPAETFTTTVIPATLVQEASPTHETGEITAADHAQALYIKANAGNYQSGRNGSKITHVTIHTTQGSYAATISWFRNAAAHRSSHYIVRASDGQITQMVKEGDMALHAQSANAYTIGIEHEGFMENGNKWYSDKLYRASAALVRDICSRRSIDESTCYRGAATAGTNLLSAAFSIKGHQHFNGQTHTDPGKYWNWNKYADLIMQKEMETAEKEIRFKTIPNGVYRITNANSRKVLNTHNCSGNQLAKVTQTSWNGQDCQRWRFEYAGEGWYKITSVVSGRALDVAGGSKENIQIHLKDTKDNDCQLWRLIEEGKKGELRLVNKASGKVLEVFAGSVNNGAAVLQTSFTGKTRQKWTIAAVNNNVTDNDDQRFRKVNLDTTEGIPTGN
jgi:N-acetyl-anhydromuramyl-L-alanine amidase AmpD